MKDILVYMAGVTVCSGVLVALYSLLLERRVKFALCRAYLPVAMVAAAVIPAIKIPVWQGEIIYMEAPAAVSVGEAIFTSEIVPDKAATVTPETICLLIYLTGAALVAGALAAQIVRMQRLRKNAVVARFEEFKLLKVNDKIASFSFFNTVFVSADTSPDDLQIILAHEAGHIRHRHSVERVAMELLKAAIWWNPFVWIAARRLTEVQEYEADSDVLANGYDVTNYTNTLLKHLFGYSPDIANGLRNSLTKKRLKMMTIKKGGRYALLRLAAVIPVVGGLMTVFSFTAKAAQIVYTSPREANPMVIVDGQKADDDALNKIDSDAIESITILKEEAAKASYAHLGDTSDGVIVVETKKAAANGEKITVSGTVVNTGSAPIAGATVTITTPKVKAGVVTDKDGKFTLQNAPASGNITVSYIGLESATMHYTKANAHNLTFVLKPDSETASKEKGLTVIKTESIETPTYTITESVSTSSLKPLVIIDGKEYDTLPDDIDSDAIESITVLKDETAKELYGERVKDGVIIIKLKENASPAAGGSTTDGIKIVGTATTQKTEQPAASYGQAAVIVAQKMPQFEGGDLMTFRQWVMSRIRFPKEALENDLFGRVVASFVIDTEGNLGDIKVLASPDEILSKEACRVLEKSPKWTPGEENGKVVNVKFTLPIDFNIQTNDALLKEDAPAAKTIEPIAVTGFK